jgi:putative DNA-invertase from lambdoid prophage Rac
MPRTFAYLRVSTAGQTTDNQLQEIKAAGWSWLDRGVAGAAIADLLTREGHRSARCSSSV